PDYDYVHPDVNYQAKMEPLDEEVTTLGPVSKIITHKQNNPETESVLTNEDAQKSKEPSVAYQQNSNEVTGEQQQSSAEVAEPTTIDPFNSNEDIISLKKVKSTTQQQNSGEVLGAQQQNSAEVTGAQHQQQNSAEVSSNNQQQQNSGEIGVPTTVDPFNSAEVIASAQNTESSSGNSANSPGSNTNPGNSNKNKDTSSIAGTQVFYPKPTNDKGVQGESNVVSQPENAGVVGTAVGTQPFYPQSVTVKEEQQESEAVIAEGAITGAGSVAGTQPFYPQSANDEPIQADATHIINNGAADRPFSPNTEDIAGNVEQADSENVAAVFPIFGTQSFVTQTVNVGNEQDYDHIPLYPTRADAANKIPGLRPFRDRETGQLLKVAGLEPISLGQNNAGSISNSLRNALSQVGVSDTFEDPLVEQAKEYFISIWNLEAHRLGAPYLEVTDVWPEIGMVYMPTINQMSSQIQNSRPVKEAAQRLTVVWEERKPLYQTSQPSQGYNSDTVPDQFGGEITRNDGYMSGSFTPVVPERGHILPLEIDQDSFESTERYDIPLHIYRLYKR
ncbi:hypothetical protein SK128_017237, partial [Halocaridina rubra]